MTDRQREVIKLAREGLTYAQIGAKLGISADTVKHHVEVIAGKSGVTKMPLRWVIANADRLLAA